jgi:vitamin B12 transporter
MAATSPTPMTATRDFAEARATWQGDAEGGPTLTTGIDWRNEQIDTDTAFNAPLSVNEAVLSLYAIGQVELGERRPSQVRSATTTMTPSAVETTHNLGAVWSLEPLSTRLRASWGTSFKAPTLSERFASSAFVTPNPDLAPEDGERRLSWALTPGSDLDERGRAELGAAWYDQRNREPDRERLRLHHLHRHKPEYRQG